MVEFIDKGFTYAVVGASRDDDKYGFRVFKNLLDDGFDVIPVNPNAREVLGVRAVPRLAAAGRRVDVVVLVVPPSVSESVVREVVALGIFKVWFQPGSDSPAAVAFCQGRGVAVMSGACIMRSR